MVHLKKKQRAKPSQPYITTLDTGHHATSLGVNMQLEDLFFNHLTKGLMGTSILQLLSGK